MRARRCVATFLVISSVACVPAEVLRGEAALIDGKPDRALVNFEQRLAERPDDARASAGRLQALRALVDARLTAAQQERERGALETALTKLAEADAFAGKAALNSPALEAERTAVRAAVERLVTEALELGRPLEARHRLDELRAALLSGGHLELAETLRQQVRAVGARRCQVLTCLSKTPWLLRFMKAWCDSFGATATEPPPMPEQRARLELDLAGVRAPEPTFLSAALTDAFNRSPWRGPSPLSLKAQLTGALDSRRDETPVSTFVTWVETESYSTTENVTETYQEPYQTTESRPYQVSYTTSESYSYSCGSGSSYRTCTGYRPVTRYRTEYRTEFVTKYRTATRQVTKTVYKTRPVTRRFDYQGTHVVATHAAKVSLAFALPGTDAPLSFELSDALSGDDLSHRATHPPAKLAPHDAVVPTPIDFASRVGVTLGRTALSALDAAWVKAFCLTVDTPELAVRCVEARSAPEAAWVPLERFTGETAARLRELVRP